MKKKDIDKEIKEDKILNDTKEAIDFIQSVASGETELEKV